MRLVTDRPWRTVVDEPPVASQGAGRDIVNGWAAATPILSPPGCGLDGIGP